MIQRLVLLIGTAASCVCAAPLSWTSVNPAPAGWIDQIIYANGRFVGLGAGGGFITSTNGMEWSGVHTEVFDAKEYVRIPHRWAHSIAFGNGLFAAAINGNIAISTNGMYWDIFYPSWNPGPGISQIVFGKGRFVAVEPYALWHYKDELLWGEVSQQLWPTSVAFGHGRFVAVGAFGKAAISRDGVRWDVVDVNSSALASVAFCRGRFLAVSENGELFLSINGRRWLQCGTLPARSNPRVFSGLRGFHVYEGSQFFGGTRQWSVTVRGRITDSLLPNGVTALARGGGITVGVGATMATSRDERRWVTRSSDFADRADIVSLAQNTNGSTIALLAPKWSGNQVGSLFAETLDGTNWNVRQFEREILVSLAYGSGRFVAVGKRGVVMAASDGLLWYRKSTGITNDFYRVRFANDRFFAFGDRICFQSRDGETWRATSVPAIGWSDVAYGNGYYVLTCGSGFRTSTDGENWIDPNNGQCCGVDILIFANGMFAGAWQNYVFSFPYPENSQIRNVTFAQGHLRTMINGAFGVLAYGDDGAAVWSPDGLSFQHAVGVPIGSVKAAAAINGHIYVVGSDGSVLRGNP